MEGKTPAQLEVATAIYASTATYALKGCHYIGESYGGGIIFWVDSSGQHGLVAAIADQGTYKGTYTRWCGLYGGSYTNTLARADGVGAGKANTVILTSRESSSTASTAARICNEYRGTDTVTGVVYGDWYLPSKYELNLLWQ